MQKLKVRVKKLTMMYFASLIKSIAMSIRPDDLRLFISSTISVSLSWCKTNELSRQAPRWALYSRSAHVTSDAISTPICKKCKFSSRHIFTGSLIKFSLRK